MGGFVWHIGSLFLLMLSSTYGSTIVYAVYYHYNVSDCSGVPIGIVYTGTTVSGCGSEPDLCSNSETCIWNDLWGDYQWCSCMKTAPDADTILPRPYIFEGTFTTKGCRTLVDGQAWPLAQCLPYSFWFSVGYSQFWTANSTYLSQWSYTNTVCSGPGSPSLYEVGECDPWWPDDRSSEYYSHMCYY
ncbi:hypothetical protein Pelo_13826 [Pelomyxa schiedti]|nr:hypothetical protein Pelo_13826 [Pelomyxa schiedti]